MDNRKISFDCRFFKGDRPCKWHKEEGEICPCRHYGPVAERILIIKLDAMGDVLRTTCILPGIKRRWPDSFISWITRPESVDLLEKNPFIDEILPYGPDSLVHLGCRTFDVVVNLDAGKISSGMASMAGSGEKIGYVLDPKGFVTATNQEADQWLRMGVFDDLKKSNQRTYQEIMGSILGLPRDELRYVMELTDAEKEAGRKSLEEIGVDVSRKILAIHAGAGGRWPLKRWRIEGFRDLIREVQDRSDSSVQICLLGGPGEAEINREILRGLKGPVFDSGCHNPVRKLASIIRCCSVVLSGDSLPMHIALAMGTRVVVLFGPTSFAEVELFEMGEKVYPDLDCLVCYRNECSVSPNCMESISLPMVKSAVFRQLDRSGKTETSKGENR